MFSQLLGFKQLLGTACEWRYLVALPLVPILVAGVSLRVFFPESPKALLETGRMDLARAALRLLRYSSAEVERDIAEFNNVQDETETPSIIRSKRKNRGVLVVSALYQVCKQLVGLLVVFFYSSSLISSIEADNVQYVVVGTCFVAAVIVYSIFGSKMRRKEFVYHKSFSSS